jgi:hypothetical protein
MKQKDIILLIVFGAIILYYAKILIFASVNAITNSEEANLSILGWIMYLVGLTSFIGALVAQVIKIVMQMTDDLENRDKERILVAILVILWTIVLCTIIAFQKEYIDALEYQVAERDNLIEKLCYDNRNEV